MKKEWAKQLLHILSTPHIRNKVLALKRVVNERNLPVAEKDRFLIWVEVGFVVFLFGISFLDFGFFLYLEFDFRNLEFN